ncbi:MAG: potassium transporter TrkG [Candidatus Aenigmatarchaeota archaeon]
MSVKSILPNLGFILQISGLFIILPVILALYYNETQSAISLLITTTAFFGLGFILNVFSQRVSLDLNSSAILLSVVFFLVSLIGCIPYIYNNIFQNDSIWIEFSNSYFESVSGFTTTGFSLITDIDSLPESLVFYRSITEWIGGISIVFILLSFFYPTGSVSQLLRLIGINGIADKMKKMLANIVLVYLIYGIILSVLLYLLVSKNLFNVVSLIFTTISTGGFSPITNLFSFLSHWGVWIVGAAMILGATNFLIHQKIIDRKFKSIFVAEFIVFLSIILIFTCVFHFVWKFDIPTSFFHVASAASTTGHSYIDISSLADNAKLILIILMFIGGMTVSTAGGIKVWRALFILKCIPWVIRQFETNKEEPVYLEGKQLEVGDVLINLFIPILFGILIFISLFFFTLRGFPLIDSLFEVTSAIATTGLSTGIVNVSLFLELKWLLIFLMVFGRIEIIPLLVAINK